MGNTYVHLTPFLIRQNVNRELKRSRPDRRRLECQCVSAVAFVKNEPELLDSPIWIMLINVVALEMLRAKMPNPGEPQMGHRGSQQSGGFIDSMTRFSILATVCKNVLLFF